MTLILLTGGTGYIGFRTLQYALDKGYHVRAAVRTDAKAKALRQKLPKHEGKLETILVPNILAPGAYDAAVKGVKYVVHLASPLPDGDTPVDDYNAEMFRPAIQGTLGILESSRKEYSVKRVVITSSMVAIVPFAGLMGQLGEDVVITPDDRAEDIPPPYPKPIVAYVQSKIASLRSAEAWMYRSQPKFDMITIHPAFVGGRNDFATSTEELLTGTNMGFFAPILGQEVVEKVGPRVAGLVDVGDVAKAHIESLDEKVAGNQAFLLTNKGGDVAWNDAKAVVQKKFPDAVGKQFPNNGSVEPHFWSRTDIEKTEKTFGKLTSFEETIEGLAGQYLELLAKEQNLGFKYHAEHGAQTFINNSLLPSYLYTSTFSLISRPWPLFIGNMAGGSTFTWKHALSLHSTLSPFDSPVPMTHPAFKKVKPVSWRRMNVSGLLVTIYGLEELPEDSGDIVCFWLLHGRGDTQDSMGLVAGAFLETWNSKRKPGQSRMICVCIDQRNHGSRMLDNRANVSWKQGNPTHGPDMFNTYTGTALDVSHLITHLPSYLPFKINEHICGGVSLGGHATWTLLMNEPRVRAGMVVIGCPDYVRLMTDRAVRSKVPSALDNNGEPNLRNFLGSQEFPPSLLEAIEKYDPAGILFGELDFITGDDHLHPPSDPEMKKLRPMMTERLAGKKIICMAGANDGLVPYKQGEPFLTWLGKAVDKKDGWFNDQSVELESIVDAKARHEFSAMMRTEAERWLCDYLAGGSSSHGQSKL
ncbi:uncharacterized protein LTR77_006734 [Saxophila tyrrhenica]|uniref:NAD-dependent epimerase/dehydratase domain-containing protein n=1 Tax=Saxophila tyrrhenica TaxID=1690608 RepID=A0AAV9P9T6_9PEZI|nr:hypothetical protein LTR77_006734 [Saxophila tyrrhenica]